MWVKYLAEEDIFLPTMKKEKQRISVKGK